MSSQKIELQIKGLWTAPNNLSGIPEGSLVVADNVVLNAKNLMESRRGQTQYGNALSVGAGQVDKIFNYSSSLISSYNSKMAYDSGNGVWVDYPGTYVSPSNDYKIRSLEAQRNFYFTSSNGIYKIDALANAPRLAGVPWALSGEGSTTGSSGFLLGGTAVAYQLTWGYKDANNNLIIGAPSQRIVVRNTSVATAATGTLAITSAVVLTSTVKGASRNGSTFRTEVNAAAANPSDSILVSFTGSGSAIVCTITPNNGTNNGGTAVNFSTANLVELINTGGVSGKNITLSDSLFLRELQTATGGNGTNMANGGNGDSITATFAAGADAQSKDVQLTFNIPEGITTEYFYQVYRTVATTTVDAEPSTELQLVLEDNPSAGEILAKTFTITDSTPFSLMGATLYTSPSQQGTENANFQPPFAVDMDVYKNCAFYANVKSKQNLTLSLISVDSPSLGYYVDGTVGTVSTSKVLSTIADTTDLRIGMKAVGTGIPDDSFITSILSGTSVEISKEATATGTVSVEFQDRFSIGGVDYFAGSSNDVSKNQFMVGTVGTPAQNINDTSLNLIKIINTSASNTTIYAYYLSGVEDLPGKILFQERGVGGVAFSASSTSGNSFTPRLPLTGTSIISTNDARQNRVFVSKNGEVESVPLYRYFDIGSANFPIQRVVALRDGIFFFKQDGIFRLSGETFESFVVALLDNTVVLKAPESAVPFNNQVFCMTTQGVVAVYDSGVRLMSVPIESTLLELSSEQFTNFSTASFGVAYESARLYIFFTVTNEDDQFATQAFVYNSLTDSWTRWVMNRTCGVVNNAINKLFMARTDTGQVLIERKSYTNQDYADEQYPVIISSIVSETQIILADATVVQPGMTLVQGFRNAYVQAKNGNILTITFTAGLTAGAAEVYTPIENKIEWAPIDAQNPGIMKQFSETTFFFKNAAFRAIEAGYTSNISAGVAPVSITNRGVGGWGNFSWGSEPWGGALGGQTALRTYVPREKQRALWLSLYLKTNEAFTGFSLQGLSFLVNPMSTRIK